MSTVAAAAPVVSRRLNPQNTYRPPASTSLLDVVGTGMGRAGPGAGRSISSTTGERPGAGSAMPAQLLRFWLISASISCTLTAVLAAESQQDAYPDPALAELNTGI